ncbi:MAG: family 10 glycosylhydrolase [Verrucomicrobia bacterium]|nr:family 10 glycosylhydrolase [Verrucomicrobiota bacterium]
MKSIRPGRLGSPSNILQSAWAIWSWLRCGVSLAAWLSVALVAQAQTPELRGWWVDTWHAAMRNQSEVDALVDTARAANFNALFVEVRKRGDAYYVSRFEPKASDVQAGFDPLAYLIMRAHDTNAGPRIEVHAWIVTYNIWNSQSSLPPQENHPFRAHPDWLTESYSGEAWDGSNYAFDPGHPEVQQHTFDVAMDIITRYDVDGLHFDYIRYAGRDWGYNPVAIALFNSQTRSTDRPSPDDSWWMQWRRDQVTSLLRRVYLTAAAVKPNVTISAATITWTPTATTFSSWLKAAPWSSVLQDWRGWMQERILDLNVPMAYFRHETHATSWAEWGRFAKQNRFQRHLAIGIGAYLNTISNSIVQMRSTRVAPGAGIPPADGLVIYSYAAPAKDATRADFVTALTTVTTNAPAPPPIFVEPVNTPPMPWKTNPQVSGATGRITNSRTGRPIEGAQVELCGDSRRLLFTDANGVYAQLIGDGIITSVVASAAGYVTRFNPLPSPGQRLLKMDFAMELDASPVAPLAPKVTPGVRSVLVSWQTLAPTRGRVIVNSEGAPGFAASSCDNRIDTRHSILVSDLPVANSPTPCQFWVRIVSEDPGKETNLSHAIQFLPAFWPIEIGEWNVRRTGDWTFVEVGSSLLHTGFWQTPATSGAPTATARWIPNIEVSGVYDLELCTFPAAGSFPALYSIVTPRTNFTVRVNHSGAMTNGILAANLLLHRGERAEVRLDNHSVSGSSQVAACRMRWRYRADQDPPPQNAVPLWWSDHFFAQPSEPADDPDNDGSSNYAEFVLGTDPTNPESHLRLSLQPAEDTGWNMLFSPLTAGRVYTLESATDVTEPDWAPIDNAQPCATETGEGCLHDPSNQPAMRFYRLKVQLR